MQNLYTITTKSEIQEDKLTDGERLSIFYHDLFDYPLDFSELIKWCASDLLIINSQQLAISHKSNYYFLGGKDGIIYKRMLRKRISAKKMEIAFKATRLLKIIPTIKMIAVTGSLAMGNATDESDIDLMVVTKSGALWTTRLFVYLFIHLLGIRTRRPGDKGQKNKLCLNIWLDEGDLVWNKKDRNIYSAHEIGQIRPLVNKDNVYEEFLWKNRWILNYWPNAVRISNKKSEIRNTKNKKAGFSVLDSAFSLTEKLAFQFQYAHMRSKITREVVTKSRAVFHPQDWSKFILSRLAS